jgi:ABC-type sugar transport system ATPase subunit
MTTTTHAPIATAASARDLTKTYGTGAAAVHALDGVDVDLAPGRFTAVMGPSGSGKSTLMHCLAGLDRPTRGTVTVDGVDLTRLDDDRLTRFRRDHLGFVFQAFNLLPMLTARQNILLPLELAGRRVDANVCDDLDEAWIKGMDRHDLKVSVVGDGVAVTGFLPFDTGTKLKTVLQSLSAPTCAEDDRPVSIRRVTALDALLSSVLASGLPQDKGVRPHVTLTADLEDLAHNPETATAELAGFGTIGPTQLQQMLCDADLTPILTAGKHTVLDVGRTHRLATPHQRKAVVNRQGGTCAGPGCHGPVVHVHHIQYWSDGGPTDLANLIGLCPRCHSAVHQGFFTIDPDTHQTHRTLRTQRTSRRARAG